MADFNLNILGCGSALPTTRHLATSQVVDLRDKLYMIDCGEGTPGADAPYAYQIQPVESYFHIPPAW